MALRKSPPITYGKCYNLNGPSNTFLSHGAFCVQPLPDGSHPQGNYVGILRWKQVQNATTMLH